MAQFFDDPSDDERHYGQEQDGEQGQLPRYEEHVDHVTDNKQRIAEGDLQRIGDAVLDHHDVLCDARHEIALALIAEISGVHPHDFVEQIVAHALQRPDTHVFDRPGAHVAEEIAQQVHYDRTAGEQEEHFRHREIRPEQLRIDVAQHLRGVDVREREPVHGKVVNGLENVGVLVVEQRVHDREDHGVGERVEQGVQQRVKEVGDGVFGDRADESQQPHVCFEHSERMFVGYAISGVKIGIITRKAKNVR